MTRSRLVRRSPRSSCSPRHCSSCSGRTHACGRSRTSTAGSPGSTSPSSRRRPECLLWHRLGVKTAALIGEYVTDVEVDTGGLEAVAIDAETFEALKQLTLFGGAGRAGSGQATSFCRRSARDHRGPAVQEAPRTGRPSCLAEPGRPPGGLASGASRRRQGLGRVPQAARWSSRERSSGRNVPRLTAASTRSRSRSGPRCPYPDPGGLRPARRAAHPRARRRRDRRHRQAVRGSRWQESQPGDREVRRQLRLVLKNNGLPPIGRPIRPRLRLHPGALLISPNQVDRARRAGTQLGDSPLRLPRVRLIQGDVQAEARVAFWQGGGGDGLRPRVSVLEFYGQRLDSCWMHDSRPRPVRQMKDID